MQPVHAGAKCPALLGQPPREEDHQEVLEPGGQDRHTPPIPHPLLHPSLPLTLLAPPSTPLHCCSLLQKLLSRRKAPFHILITSYQLVVTDAKYFQRVKWQYMILDEAQAIKSSNRSGGEGEGREGGREEGKDGRGVKRGGGRGRGRRGGEGGKSGRGGEGGESGEREARGEGGGVSRLY